MLNQILRKMNVTYLPNILACVAWRLCRTHYWAGEATKARATQSPPSFSALAQLGLFARPTKTAILRRLQTFLTHPCPKMVTGGVANDFLYCWVDMTWPSVLACKKEITARSEKEVAKEVLALHSHTVTGKWLR